MINNDTAKSIYTITDGVIEYPIGFQYMWKENNQPQILVYVGPEANRYLEYGTDFTVSDDGLSVVLSAEIEAGTKLSIMSDVPFVQGSDYVVGRIDPEQIERDFDKTVLRDLQLRDYADDINDRLVDEESARTAADTSLQETINTKQDTIADLATIRSGAAAGATAVQPADLATVATTGSYNDLSDKPTITTVGAGTITIKQGGVTKATFNVNQSSDTEVELDQGGGDVESVNGKTGVVVLNATDVHALADSTKYAASLAFTVDPTTFVVTAQLKDQDNNNLGTAQIIDLPLESVVVSGAYDSVTKEVVLTLENGSTVRFSVADLISGLQTEITSTNKLDADLVDDTTSTHKFVTAADKTSWDNKVSKNGDTVNGNYFFSENSYIGKKENGQEIVIGYKLNGSDYLYENLVFRTDAINFALYPTGSSSTLGKSGNKWKSVYVQKINNGADIAVPTSGGTMARVEDLPSVMTGADGTNAGTSGLVPAPAATDNDKFLSGDGTWKAAGGGATYTAGNGINIDANNEISVADPVLVNKATGIESLSISNGGTSQPQSVNVGVNSSLGGSQCVALGYLARTNSSRSVAIGFSSFAFGGSTIAIGCDAQAVARGSIQISTYNRLMQNTDANTFKVANANGNFEIMSADGTIPTARLTKVNTTATLAVADWSSNTQTISVTGVTATSVVFVSPATASASDYADAGILCTAQGAGTLTFTCDTVPSNAITVNIVCL